MSTMTLAVVGSRDLTDVAFFEDKMKQITSQWGVPDCVVSGGCRGADAFGEAWAKRKGIKTLIYKPDWNKHGKSSGIIRNANIIDAATHVVAFPSRGGRGTQNSISRAYKAKIPVEIFFID